MLYALVCLYCRGTIEITARVGDEEARAILDHLRRLHPGAVHEEPSFAKLFGHVRVKMTWDKRGRVPARRLVASPSPG